MNKEKNQDFETVIKTRSATRKFKDKLVEDEKINKNEYGNLLVL